jgi:uncharacterized OB-fold protein
VFIAFVELTEGPIILASLTDITLTPDNTSHSILPEEIFKFIGTTVHAVLRKQYTNGPTGIINYSIKFVPVKS